MNRADTSLWYGDTGTGKTAQIGEVAKWHHSRTGQVTRLISADSGWDPIEDLIQEGIVEAWNIQYLQNPTAVLVKMSEGAWPEVYMKPDGKPGLRMVPPSPETWKRIGQYAIEGLSTIGDMLLQDHIRNQRKLGQDVVGVFSVQVDVVDGGKTIPQSLSFAKASPSHYGQVQDFLLLDLVPRFATLPVERVMWTAHEGKGADEFVQSQQILGPGTVGKAVVGKTARKFGDTFHFVKTSVPSVDPRTKVASSALEYRAYYEDHPDDVLTKMLWPAKLSLPLARAAELRSRFGSGYVPMTLAAGMVQYMDFKYGAQAREAAK